MTDCDFGEGKPDLQEGPWQIQPVLEPGVWDGGPAATCEYTDSTQSCSGSHIWLLS